MPCWACLGRCTPKTLRHRFHGPGDGVAYTRAQLDRAGDIVVVAWRDDRCVGTGVLGRAGGGPFHLGLLVEDAEQHRGVGTRLVVALLAEARTRGITGLHADVMGDDRPFVALLRRLGPAQVAFGMDGYSVDIDLAGPA